MLGKEAGTYNDIDDTENNQDVELDPDSKGVQLGRDAITINPASTIGEELRELLTGIEQIGFTTVQMEDGTYRIPFVIEDPTGLASVYNYETLFNEMLVDLYNYFKDDLENKKLPLEILFFDLKNFENNIDFIPQVQNNPQS